MTLSRSVFGVAFAAILAVQPIAAFADGATDANLQWPIASSPATSDDTPIVTVQPSGRAVAQAQAQSQTPVVPPAHIPIWPNGLDYTLDASSAWALGSTGAPTGSGLSGGMDVIARYGFSLSSRLVVGYYDLQEYPLGFDTGVVPVYLQGVATPISTANLATTPINTMIQNHLIIAHYDQILWTKVMGGDFPVIISPTYTTRWGSVGGGTDYLPVEINGLPYLEHYRTGSYYALGVTIPLPLLTNPTRGLFTTYTIGPQWATSATGANASNNPQLVQILHLIYRPTPQIQIDLQPSLYPNMLPTDVWPQHYLTMIYSLAYSFGRDRFDPWGRPLTHRVIPFVQGTVSMGGAINESPYGISGLYCQSLPCTSPSQLVPALGGNHAAQVQLKVGIGRPDVIPL